MDERAFRALELAPGVGTEPLKGRLIMYSVPTERSAEELQDGQLIHHALASLLVMNGLVTEKVTTHGLCHLFPGLKFTSKAFYIKLGFKEFGLSKKLL